MRFTKAHGTGNDFVVVPDWGGRLELTASLVRALCDRHQGLGGDGVLRIVSGEDGADVFMDYRNADGSVAETCGNGIRVVAHHVVEHGLVAADAGTVRVGTRAGTTQVELQRDLDGHVVAATVEMGAPVFEPARIPFETDAGGANIGVGDVTGVEVRVGETTVPVSVVSMGNPHAVVLVEDLETAPVADLGPRLETHRRFPEGTNVEFVQVLSRDEVFARVWERGVGETEACGSGACAVVVALQRSGQAGREATVRFPGGDLVVAYDPEEHRSVFLTGAAVEVAAGEINGHWLTSVAGSRLATEGSATA